MVFVFRWWPEPALLSAPVQYEGALATLSQGTGIPVVQCIGAPVAVAVPVPPRGNLTILVQRKGVPARGRVPPVPA